MRILAAIISAAALSGCAGRYVEPEPTTSHSILNYKSGLSGAFTGSSLFALDDATCNTHHRHMAGLTWATGREKALRITPDKILYLGVQSEINKSSMQASQSVINVNYCQNIVSFIPEEGHKYEASHEWGNGRCEARIIDSATMKEPKSFVSYKVPSSCILGGK